MPAPTSNLPDQSLPLVDPKTGRVNQEWYIYLKALDTLLRTL